MLIKHVKPFPMSICPQYLHMEVVKPALTILHMGPEAALTMALKLALCSPPTPRHHLILQNSLSTPAHHQL